MVSQDAAGDRVVIGRILKASGVRGEVRVLPLTDFPERFVSLKEAYLVGRDRRTQRIGVEGARPGGKSVILKLNGVDDRGSAEKLAGATLEVGPDEAVPLPKGRYYVFDIVGLEVVTDEGRKVGQVKDVLKLPPYDLYVIEDDRGEEMMVPAVEAIVLKVDLSSRQMVICPPEGLIPRDAD